MSIKLVNQVTISDHNSVGRIVLFKRRSRRSALERFCFFSLSKQPSSLRNLFEGNDLLAVLPTGFGNSLIFQLLVLVVEVRRKRRGERGFASIVVISSLQSIMLDQVVEVVSMGITPLKFGSGQLRTWGFVYDKV